MSPFESQLIAAVVFGLIVSTLPRLINRWPTVGASQDDPLFYPF